MRKRLGGIEGGKILRLIVQSLLAASIMGVSVYLITLNGLNKYSLVGFSLGIVIGVIVFGFSSLLIGIDEVRLLPQIKSSSGKIGI